MKRTVPSAKRFSMNFCFCMNSLKQIRQQFLASAGRILTLFCLAMVASGCATSQTVFHGLMYCNIGAEAVTIEAIQYGRINPVGRPLTLSKGNPLCLSGVNTAGEMEIPESALIRWESKGKKISVDVPIRSRLTELPFFHSIIVKFDAENVYVVQRIRYQVGNSREVQIFP